MQEYAANTQAHLWQTSSEENALKSWFYGKQVVNVNPCSRCTDSSSIFVPNYSLHGSLRAIPRRKKKAYQAVLVNGT